MTCSRHNKTETAEERVRAAMDMSEPPPRADLRAFLAELDLYRAGNRVLMDRHKELHAQIKDLTAQRPVDVEAVLAPIREVRDSVAKSMWQHGDRVQSCVADGSYEYAHAHEAQRQALLAVVADMNTALCEAEKIGRGE